MKKRWHLLRGVLVGTVCWLFAQVMLCVMLSRMNTNTSAGALFGIAFIAAVGIQAPAWKPFFLRLLTAAPTWPILCIFLDISHLYVQAKQIEMGFGEGFAVILVLIMGVYGFLIGTGLAAVITALRKRNLRADPSA